MFTLLIENSKKPMIWFASIGETKGLKHKVAYLIINKVVL